MDRRNHYEIAFEAFLRELRLPYVAVDESKKALFSGSKLKSFDFVVYGRQGNLLVDVKGRMYGGSPRSRSATPGSPSSATSSAAASSGARYESWVTQDDVDSLAQWQELFGGEFTAVFVFLYCLRRQPPDALFEELFEFAGRWYAPREVALAEYRREMITRSQKWGTVHVPAAKFMTISCEFRPQRDPMNSARSIAGGRQLAPG